MNAHARRARAHARRASPRSQRRKRTLRTRKKKRQPRTNRCRRMKNRSISQTLPAPRHRAARGAARARFLVTLITRGSAAVYGFATMTCEEWISRRVPTFITQHWAPLAVLAPPVWVAAVVAAAAVHQDPAVPAKLTLGN